VAPSSTTPTSFPPGLAASAYDPQERLQPRSAPCSVLRQPTTRHPLRQGPPNEEPRKEREPRTRAGCDHHDRGLAEPGYRRAATRPEGDRRLALLARPPPRAGCPCGPLRGSRLRRRQGRHEPSVGSRLCRSAQSKTKTSHRSAIGNRSTGTTVARHSAGGTNPTADVEAASAFSRGAAAYPGRVCARRVRRG
jgi:hypothetical protein